MQLIHLLTRLSALVVLALVMLVGPLQAETEARNRAVELFDQVRADTLEPKDAMDLVKDLPGAANDPVLVAIQGSLMSMQAKEAWFPFRRLQLVNEGIELLDDAAASISPEQDGYLQVYMTAAVTNASVPGFLGRSDFAERFFLSVAQHPRFPRMAPSDRATVFAWRAVLTGLTTSEGASLAKEALFIDPTTANAILNRN